MNLKQLTTLSFMLFLMIGFAQTHPELAKQLDSIYEEDQKYRKQIGPIIKEHGQDSKEFQELAMTMIKTDASNLAVVEQILNNYGWLGPDAVGKKANQTLFLVVQHADLETQKQYMPMMEQAVIDGKAKPQNFALLKDRVLLGMGKKQLYGSQIGSDKSTGKYYVKPIENPENVNQRRKEMGLGPIEDYVKRWQIEWSVENHLKYIEQFEN
jgi:hypothetical protein